jgi:hypothetical protein
MTNASSYRHLQVGWAMLGLMLLPTPLLWCALRASGTQVLLWVGIPIVLVTSATFATLSVEVDHAFVHMKFGLGLVARHFPLAKIRSFSQVTNPWYYGWGIHIFPGGTLYNVSGLSAVELVHADGRRVRIGTDKPEELVLALQRALDRLPSAAAAPASRTRHTRHWAWALLVLAVCAALAIPLLIHFQSRPPVVTVSSRGFTVDNPFYGQTYRLTEVTKVELLPALPPIRLRTNGYAAGGTLRGWFSLGSFGNGKLFVEAGHPPYVAVTLREGFVIINYAEPNDTERLYAALQAAFAQRD